MDRSVVELISKWNGPLSLGFAIEDLTKIRIWLFGGGGLLLVLGIFFYLNNSTPGPFLIFISIILIVLGIFIEIIKNKQSLQGTSIDFQPEVKNNIYRVCEQFLKENNYNYKPTQENYGLIKGNGFELIPSGIKIILFDIKAPMSGQVLRLGIRNINESTLQEGIILQIKLDNHFVNNNLIGKNPQNVRTRFLWDGNKYIPMR
jgi:hypothetical protein